MLGLLIVGPLVDLIVISRRIDFPLGFSWTSPAYAFKIAGQPRTEFWRSLLISHGIAWLLPRLIGPMNALDLLYTARMVEAEEAERMGLVRVLPAEGFAKGVQARAAEIANLSSPRSTRIIKKQVYEAMFQSLAEATVLANCEQEICRDTEDFREGVAHYLEKRKPSFTGR